MLFEARSCRSSTAITARKFNFWNSHRHTVARALEGQFRTACSWHEAKGKRQADLSRVVIAMWLICQSQVTINGGSCRSPSTRSWAQTLDPCHVKPLYAQQPRGEKSTIGWLDLCFDPSDPRFITGPIALDMAAESHSTLHQNAMNPFPL